MRTLHPHMLRARVVMFVTVLCLALLAQSTQSIPLTQNRALIHERGQSEWNCTVISNTTVSPTTNDVWWTKYNCTGVVPRTVGSATKVGPIVVNIVHAMIANSSYSPKLRPTIARTPLGLAQLHEMAASAATPEFTPLAGVNGGYFFEVNRKDFFDDVCFGKVREDALKNVSMTDPNAGIGDGLTILNGDYVSSNCDKWGNSKPVAAILDFPPRFVKLERAQRLQEGVQWAIAAGPNLVSLNTTTGSSYIDIEGDNVNILEHASNTALALRGKSEFMVIAFDGEDGCTEYKPTCGVDSLQLAYFLLDYLNVTTAMEMDQGGSTAMWVRGQPANGIVSNPGNSERQLFNSVFIGI